MIDLNCGIYQIANLINEMRYIGQAQDVEGRWKIHRKSLQKGNHYNPHLQAAWNLYGEDAFEFQLIEPCSKEQLTEREQYWIDQFDFETLYNIAQYVENPNRGRKFSAETRAKMSAAKRGKMRDSFSAETRAKMSAAWRGRVVSDETRAKMSASQKLRHAAKRTLSNFTTAGNML